MKRKGLKRVKCIHCDGHHYVRRPSGGLVLCYFCKKTHKPYVVYLRW